MTEINIFENAEFGKVRVVMNGGEPMFCMSDVASALEYANPAKAVIDHCKGVTVLETPTEGGVQRVKFGKEGEVYRLIMKSKSKKAEQFQDWVCNEVLPSIRKHGAYMTEQTIEKALTNPDFLIQLATNLKEEQKKRVEAEAKVEELKPKAEYHDKVLYTESCYTTTQIAKELEMSGRQLNILLKNMGVQYKQSGQWLLTKEYQDKGYVKTRTHIIDHERTKHTTVWTEKGREFLIDLAEDF